MDRYAPQDSTLSCYDHGLAELWRDGEVRAYLGCRVGRFGVRGDGGPWPWFVVAWPDGRKEMSFEDYGPEWWTVRELDQGYFNHWSGPPVEKPVRVLGLPLGTRSVQGGELVDYRVAWLPPEQVDRRERELGLTDRDF